MSHFRASVEPVPVYLVDQCVGARGVGCQIGRWMQGGYGVGGYQSEYQGGYLYTELGLALCLYTEPGLGPVPVH